MKINRITYVNNACRHSVSAILDHVTHATLKSHASMSDPNYNKLLLHKIDKIKMAGTSREISSVMTSAANKYSTRLDSSVRIKTRTRTEVT